MPLGSSPVQGKKLERRTGQREKLGCATVSKKAIVDHRWGCEAGMALSNCLSWGELAEPPYAHHYQALDTSYPGKGA